jgi:hypothetical protein
MRKRRGGGAAAVAFAVDEAWTRGPHRQRFGEAALDERVAHRWKGKRRGKRRGASVWKTRSRSGVDRRGEAERRADWERRRCGRPTRRGPRGGGAAGKGWARDDPNNLGRES